MNLVKMISVSTVFDVLADRYVDYLLRTSRAEMMGVSDHAFLYHSLEMPYRTAHEAFQNLKNFSSFKFNGGPIARTVRSSSLSTGLRIDGRTKKHVYVFNYIDDVYNRDVFMYEKESGQLFRLDHEEAELMFRWLLLSERT